MRFAVLSDIHGNLQAFQAVLADMDALGIDRALNLGDVIGYGPDPEDCVRLLRERGFATVLGNHEHATLDPRHKRWFNTTSRRAVDMTDDLISDDTRDWIRTLPSSIVFEGFRFVHGFPPENLHLYLFGVDDQRLARTFADSDESYVFLGHTHDLELVSWDGGEVERAPLPPGATRLREGWRYMLNVGSVGQPRDDYDTRAKYAVFDEQARTCEIRALEYDRELTARRIRERGIPELYAERLLR